MAKKRKVTLSIDSEVYEKYKEFCDKHAYLLSKKIENNMKEDMKNE